NAYDTAVTLMVAVAINREFEKWPKLQWIYWNDVWPGTWTAMEMSLNGLEFDERARKELDVHLTAKVTWLLTYIRQFPSVIATEELLGKPFNPGSSQQKIEALYGYECLPII